MKAEDFLNEANIDVIEDALACIFQYLKPIHGNEVRASLVASKILVFLIVATYYSFVANAAHDRHKYFNVTILATDLLFESWLEEGVEAFGSN